MFHRLQQFTTSKTGSKVLGGLAALTAFGGGCAYLVPQGLLLDKCVTIFQLHQDGFPVELPKSLEEKGKEVLDKTQLKPKQKDLVRFFNVYGLDVYHLGSTSTTNGACIGIPKNFNYKKPEDVQQSDIALNQSSDVPWNSEAGRNLKESLVLSDRAQKFAIAKEIYYASYPRLHVLSIGTIVTMMTSITLSKWGNEKYMLIQRPFKVRLVWYGLTCGLGLAFWVTLKDMFAVFMDSQCDKHASDLGSDYVDGGIEYYQKKMLLNRSLRTLMGSKGEKYYTAHGNYYTLFRNKSLPLSQRLDTLKSRQKDLQENDSAS